MSLQWVSAAAFLYSEIALGILLCLPFVSNSRWQRIFHSRLLSLVREYGNFYFSAFVLIMVLLFADSAFQTQKYSRIDHSSVDLKNNPQAEIQAHMKLFRAQRNLYISGFSLFMLWVLRRLITLISTQATLEASHEATLKQALGATEQCKVLLDENEKLKKAKGSDDDSQSDEEKHEIKKELEEKNKELEDKEKELDKAKKDLQAIKSQAEGINKEYDRLVEEYNKLEKKLAIQGEESKKDD